MTQRRSRGYEEERLTELETRLYTLERVTVKGPFRFSVQDEGIDLGTVTILNFTGAGVSASVTGTTATVIV